MTRMLRRLLSEGHGHAVLVAQFRLAEASTFAVAVLLGQGLAEVMEPFFKLSSSVVLKKDLSGSNVPTASTRNMLTKRSHDLMMVVES